MIKRTLLLPLLVILSLNAVATDLNLQDRYPLFEEGTIDLKSLLGKKPVYLKFWATWCLECREELPSLQKAFHKYGSKIAMFAVNLNINESADQIRNFQNLYKLSIPIVMDENHSIAGNFDFYGTPFHVLINRQGEVVYTTYKDDDKLANALQSLASAQVFKSEPQKKPVATAALETTTPTQRSTAAIADGFSLVFITATWCDWYMEDIDPEMAKSCIAATHLANNLHKANPRIPFQGYVTSLWTETKDVQAYRNKYVIEYPVARDITNRIARQYNAVEFPTLLLLNQGQEVYRVTDFLDEKKILDHIHNLIKEAMS